MKNKEFYKKLLTLVLPIAFQNFMMAAVSASDALMLGFIDQESLSAVSLAGQIQFVLSLFLFALSAGTTILSAQYWGKGEKDAVEKIMAISLRFSFFISLLFFLAATFVPQLLMMVFTSEEVLISKGCEYLRLIGLSYLLNGITQIYLCIMKNSGRTLKSTIIGSSSMVLNIGLNALLIFGIGIFPGMGIAGAAIATVIAKIIEFVWAVAESLKKDRVRLRFRYLVHRDAVLLKDYTRYTLPVLGNELAWGCGFTMYSVIMGHLGNDAVASNSLANIIKNLITCFCMGIGNGGGIIIGNELGRGALEKAKEYGDKLCHLSIVSGVISGAVLLGLMPVILRFAKLSMVARGYLVGMLLVCAVNLIGKSVNATVIAGIFCAGGDSKFGMFCDFITMWVFAVPVGFLTAFWLKLPVLAVFFIINMDEIVKLPAVYIHYKKYNWVRDLTR